jgi:D-sedoheptulose 7-phosphate isomerase
VGAQGRPRNACAGNKIIFVGNGGSAGIASHLAIDFSKNGGLRSLAFNDASALTCLGNDLGYENVFAKQLDFHARPGDLLIAISSSGRSPNILNAVKAARAHDCKVVTFSGFTEENDLRKTGDVNFYIGRMNTASSRLPIWPSATPCSISTWAGEGRLKPTALPN